MTSVRSQHYRHQTQLSDRLFPVTVVDTPLQPSTQPAAVRRMSFPTFRRKYISVRSAYFICCRKDRLFQEHFCNPQTQLVPGVSHTSVSWITVHECLCSNVAKSSLENLLIFEKCV